MKRLVYASSSSVYGNSDVIPFKETANVDTPISLYAATKKSNELMAHTYAHLYGIETIGLRFFTVYGPWGRPDMSLFLFTKKILDGEPIDVFNYGNHRRDFTYVDDIVEGVIRCIDQPAAPNDAWTGDEPDPGTSKAPYRLYNIGNNAPVELMDFIGAIEKCLGIEAQKNMLPLQLGDVPDTYSNTDNLVNEFNYKPSTTVNTGVKEFVDWYIEQAQANGCETGIFCGDWHHNRNSLNLTTMDSTIRCMEKLGKAFEKFYFFDGNHDLYYKDKRDVNSTAFAKHIPGITFIDEVHIEDDVALVPWLVGDEWRTIKSIKSKYMFGHFELPSFYMNAMVQMPDHGELKAEHFEHQEYVFSGHFHKRQKQGKVHYLGNAFPHNYADAWDDDRGMMILDRENNAEPVYINWPDCPKYRTVKLSQLIDEQATLIKPNMYLRVNLDLPISYEEASFIKETFINNFGCREISLIPQKQLEEISTELDIQQFESVDQIVAGEINAIDSDNFNKKMLMDIYNEL